MNNGKPALFLDRDGVINRDSGFVSKVEDFEFFPEIIEICSISRRLKFPIVIITNQSGIGRGYFTEGDFWDLTRWMIDEFAKYGIEISLVLHASDNPDLHSYSPVVSRRKPSPEMFLEAKKKLKINLQESIMIGDRETDMIAAQRAGVEHRILINHDSASSAATIVVANHLACLSAVKSILL